jgi:diadenosine tetraphosphatase ApaH/serine/threonine PP2A family protein phosphatase
MWIPLASSIVRHVVRANVPRTRCSYGLALRCASSTASGAVRSLDDVKAIIDTFSRGETPSLATIQSVLVDSRKQHEQLPNLVRVPIPSPPPPAAGAVSGMDAVAPMTLLSIEEGGMPTTVSAREDEPQAPPGGLIIVGDTHGQFADLVGKIFSDQVAGFPSPHNVFIFNGDFVDRGENSVGVIITLLAIKLALPDALHLVRGNHESIQMNIMFGFTDELQKKFGNEALPLFHLFTETFNALPLAAIVHDSVFVVHGGIGPVTYKMKLDELDRLNRFKQPDFAQRPLDSMREAEPPILTDEELQELNGVGELLWSDPADRTQGFKRSSRGGGTTAFGADITQQFLELNGLQYMVRSHVMKQAGFSVGHDGLCLTVFSAPNYCGARNLGAVLRYRDPSMIMHPEVVQYKALNHPPPKPMSSLDME